ERIREAVKMRAVHAPGQVDAGGDIAPLIAAAQLQIAMGLFAQGDKNVGHHEHVAEFGEGEATLALQAAFDRNFGEHAIYGKMLTDIAEEFEVAEWANPIEVVDQDRRIAGNVEVEKLL